MTKTDLEKQITEISSMIDEFGEAIEGLKRIKGKMVSLIDDIPDPLELDEEDEEDEK